MPENARLAFFGEWVIHSVSRGATELGITDSERIGLLERLVADRFTYVRTDKVRGDKGATMRCTARFEHSPTTVVLTVLCRGMDGSEHSRVVEGAFRRDELDYGSSVESITLSDHGEMMIKTYKGWI